MLRWSCLILVVIIPHHMSAMPVAIIPEKEMAESLPLRYDVDDSENEEMQSKKKIIPTSKLLFQNAINLSHDANGLDGSFRNGYSIYLSNPSHGNQWLGCKGYRDSGTKDYYGVSTMPERLAHTKWKIYKWHSQATGCIRSGDEISLRNPTHKNQYLHCYSYVAQGYGVSTWPTKKSSTKFTIHKWNQATGCIRDTDEIYLRNPSHSNQYLTAYGHSHWYSDYNRDGYGISTWPTKTSATKFIIRGTKVYDYFSIWGDCERTGDCVSSKNFPSKYGNREECLVTLTNQASNTQVNQLFSIQGCCDKLLINGSPYKNSTHIPKTLNDGSQIKWTTDASETKAGWKMCFYGQCKSIDIVDFKGEIRDQKLNNVQTREYEGNNCETVSSVLGPFKYLEEEFKSTTSSYTISKSISETFSAGVEASVTISAQAGFNVGVASATAGQSATLSASFGWDKTTVGTQTSETITQNTIKKSSEITLEFPVPGGTHKKFSGYMSTGTAHIDWTAMAICKSEHNIVLQTKPISGTYLGTQTSSTKFVTTDIPCVNKKIEQYYLAPSSCRPGDSVPKEQCEEAAASTHTHTPGRTMRVGSGSSCITGNGWRNVPIGCSVSGGDWTAHFKTGGADCSHPGYQSVCLNDEWIP